MCVSACPYSNMHVWEDIYDDDDDDDDDDIYHEGRHQVG